MPISKINPNSLGGVPCFSAYQSSTQTALSVGTFTKIQFQTKRFDTNGFYDNTTNYRFQPTIAGYYMVIGQVGRPSPSGEVIASIFKNGSEYHRGVDVGSSWMSNANTIMYFNGSTDYAEIYGYFSASASPVNDSTQTNFQAVLVRAA